MKYVIMDTSHTYLNLALVVDDVIVSSYAQESHKSQSENIIPQLEKLFSDQKWTVDELDGVVVTRGPGSYTGVRIAMTVAKVLCTSKSIDLYTVSTLQAYAGKHSNVLAVLDARSNRVFAGAYQEGNSFIEDSILSLDEAKQLVETHNFKVVGDAHLIDHESLPIDVLKNIVELRALWEKVEQVHQLTPVYLKEQDAYGK